MEEIMAHVEKRKADPFNMEDDGFYWFPLNAGDFLMKTSTLNSEATGCYILLLTHLTRHKLLVKDESSIRMICKGADSKSIAQALSLLNEFDEFFTSNEIDAARHKAASISEKLSAAGRVGAQARWKNKRVNNADNEVNQCQSQPKTNTTNLTKKS